MTTPVIPSYAGYRFPAEIISHAVWLYFRFPLSLRMVDELLAARGVIVSYETVRQWAEFALGRAQEAQRPQQQGGELAPPSASIPATPSLEPSLAPPTRQRERQMKRFKSAGQVQRFLSAHDGINNLFLLRRHQVPAVQYRAARTQAIQVWAEVTGVAAAA